MKIPQTRIDLSRFQADRVFTRTNGVLLSALALVSYLPPEEQTERLDGLESFRFLDSKHNQALGHEAPDTGTQVSLFETRDALIVTPRGTPLELSEHPDVNLQWADLKNDFNCKPTPNHDGSAWVHAGFKQAADGIWGQVKPYLAQALAANKAVHFAGHSLGGAIATHLASRMHGELGRLPQSLLTEGGPSTGWKGQLHHLNRIGLADRTVRLVNNTDPVPGLVPWGSVSGSTVYFATDGQADLGHRSRFWDRLRGIGDSLWNLNFNPLQDHYPGEYTRRLADPRNAPVLEALAAKLNG